MIFPLQQPPGFEPLDPHREIHVYRRHLPHWRQEGATYFVTFRLGDSIPQAKLEELCELRQVWENSRPEAHTHEDWQRFASRYTRLAERCLDEGHGACWLRRAAFARIVAAALEHFQGQRYLLSSHAVMPNHVHTTVRPLGSYTLEKILGGWKGYTARMINQALGRSGPLWEQESYDRLIRDGRHLWRVLQYIGNNPGRAGIPEAKRVRWVHPDWVRAGWGFDAGS